MTELPIIICGPLWQVGEVGGQGFLFADGEAICPIRGMSAEQDSMGMVLDFFEWATKTPHWEVMTSRGPTGTRSNDPVNHLWDQLERFPRR